MQDYYVEKQKLGPKATPEQLQQARSKAYEEAGPAIQKDYEKKFKKTESEIKEKVLTDVVANTLGLSNSSKKDATHTPSTSRFGTPVKIEGSGSDKKIESSSSKKNNSPTTGNVEGAGSAKPVFFNKNN